MCGITGAVWNDPRLAIDAETLARMTDALAHRGPDDRGTYLRDYQLRPPYPPDPGVALGHRRLAILDRAGSRQPLANEDGSIQVVFNGEIYNYRDLRQRLEGSGHQLRTRGDTETLVHLYEDEGVDFPRHLDGMFALAIWDAPRRRLFLARDRLGKKPLVYRLEADRLFFASELKSLRQVAGLGWELDPAAIDEFLTFQYIPHPNTIYREARKLPPGHYALYEEGRLTVRPYWRPAWDREIERPTADYVDELRETLARAVRLRMQSEVPLGAFLSGGVDSSIVAALMQRESPTPIQTFSIGFDEAEFDETAAARRVADHLRTEHREFRVRPDAAALLPRLFLHYDEPFGDSSALPTWYLAERTREHVTVALSGDGGDELFAGYDRYRAVRLGAWLDRLPRVCMAPLAARLWQRIPSGSRQKGLLRRFKRFSEALSLSPERRYAEWVTIFNESRRAALYTEEFLARLPDSDPLEFLFEPFRLAAGRDRVTAASLVDLVTYLPCDLLTKVDMATMAHGLECRQPLLDHHVVELAAAMPLTLKLRGRRSKRILRLAFGDLVPAEVFQRPKMGFGIPVARWFRQELGELVRATLLSPAARERGLFRPEAIERLLAEHASGHFDHGYRLWSLLTLEMWAGDA